MRKFGTIAAAAAAAALLTMSATGALAVTKKNQTLNGLKVTKFTWTDSQGLKRSVSLKRQGLGNPGNGGYAIRMTYQVREPSGTLRTVTADAPANEGFGYFVSHERYRYFSDGSERPISRKIFGKDDSPLGRGFPVTTVDGLDNEKRKSVIFKLTYPRYGTKAAGGINSDTGRDQPPLGTAKGLFALYDLPVTIEWTFQDGRDYPRITTAVSLKKLPGPDRVSFDLRGPYGKLDFDDGNNPISGVTWGDRYLFQSNGSPLTRNSTWTWNQPNGGARFIGITAGGYEMGLLEPRTYATSQINDGFAYGRGETSATHSTANAGCPGQELPCDYEWPYQATNYELPYDNPNGSTTSEKIAWGSTPFYGTTLAGTWDGTGSTPLDGFPASKKLVYSVCVVLGETVAGGLTRFVAEGGGNYSCATN
ncbi:MAG: hypothetical protein DI565_18015 [Ancylobacter novellus]|uniref:Uncharacterized protein n=1 Tax=Ancylobacter novellus TaxID=921 RepID=A0A2W5K7Z7_ANCNO|nr:MAG: hypothetical protein DI565_18015 [Ancylobacter novellus]